MTPNAWQALFVRNMFVRPPRADLAWPEAHPTATFTTFDGLELTVVFWIADSENGTLNVRSDVNLAILRALARQGVGIPYPQRVVHHKSPPHCKAS